MSAPSSAAVMIAITQPPTRWPELVAGLSDSDKDYLRGIYSKKMTEYLSHRGDPDTSRQAAQRAVASGSVEDHMRIVASAVRAHPGHTSAELVRYTGLERHEVARRTADAEHAGLIRKGVSRKCSVSGRKAVTWHVPLTQSQRECLWGEA